MTVDFRAFTLDDQNTGKSTYAELNTEDQRVQVKIDNKGVSLSTWDKETNRYVLKYHSAGMKAQGPQEGPFSTGPIGIPDQPDHPRKNVLQTCLDEHKAANPPGPVAERKPDKITETDGDKMLASVVKENLTTDLEASGEGNKERYKESPCHFHDLAYDDPGSSISRKECDQIANIVRTVPTHDKAGNLLTDLEREGIRNSWVQRAATDNAAEQKAAGMGVE